ncbi:MotE family protein [Evansella tamaricis]|uniref:Magnesium transporter MgtE intracellular domain-containing protein n=1 Tax=Evansella tamaricis TaxID=2069301 RepID=A0ABS6JLV0_9BACI|nr:hypothetical protein [Evansella tamaricis]MBU9714551.1 hypothetical protein [Evansella tamaricis]
MSKDEVQSKWQVFFMLIIIPAIFAIILAVAFLNFFDVNVGETLKKTVTFLPFVEDTEEVTLDPIEYEETITQLQDENANFLSTINQLEQQIQQKEELITDLEAQVQQLLNTEETEQDQETTTEENRAELSDVVRTLETMTASKAALIVSEMAEDEAVMYLRIMKLDSRAQILSRVDPGKAAELISKLSN